MRGSPAMPSADPPLESRRALVVATGSYADAGLRRLRAPAQDAANLARVLADQKIGGFTVTTVIDQPAQKIRLAIEDFLDERGTGDLMLVYLSCHGLLDGYRKLYFAATDTRRDRLAATGVEAVWVLEQLEHCRARRQVLILDSCFSGAFAHGAKGETDIGLGDRFLGQGRGRVVLTASTAAEYSFEGEPAAAATAKQAGSVFTAALVQGLRTGAADTDRDGLVSVDDAYAYVFDQVQASGATQTPQRWLYGAEGRIVLARSPAGPTVTPAPLPESLRAGLDSPLPGIRMGAVTELGGWLSSDDPARVATARRHLREVVDTDIPSVARTARALLDTGNSGAPVGTGNSGAPVGTGNSGAPGARLWPQVGQSFVAARADQARGYYQGRKLATWWQRVGAYLIDWLPLVPGITVWEVGGAKHLSLLIALGVVATVPLWLYNRCYLQGRTGQSWGKRATGLKLIRMSDNEPTDWQMATIREVAHFLDLLVFYLGFLLPILDARRQTLADKAMRTVVISTRGS
jgi:uncharacterized RDD family membrane protein YckC